MTNSVFAWSTGQWFHSHSAWTLHLYHHHHQQQQQHHHKQSACMALPSNFLQKASIISCPICIIFLWYSLWDKKRALYQGLVYSGGISAGATAMSGGWTGGCCGGSSVPVWRGLFSSIATLVGSMEHKLGSAMGFTPVGQEGRVLALPCVVSLGIATVDIVLMSCASFRWGWGESSSHWQISLRVIDDL